MLRFLRQDVTWVDLGALARRLGLDPTLALLPLPVQPQPDLAPTCQRILWRHTSLFQEILAEGLREGLWEGRDKGRAEGLAEGASEGRHREALTLTLRQLERRLGLLDAACRARVEGLTLERLEDLALALLDGHDAEELVGWLDGGEG